MERWKPVVGYEGVYSVSNLGNVRRELKARGAGVGADQISRIVNFKAWKTAKS